MHPKKSLSLILFASLVSLMSCATVSDQQSENPVNVTQGETERPRYVSPVENTSKPAPGLDEYQGLSAEEMLAEVDTLVADRRYATAFALLGEAQKKSPDAAILVRIFRFIPEYFVQSMMHQMFVFADLDPDEDLMELRRYLPEGSYDFTLYDPIQVYEDFIAKYGTTAELDLAMGEWYLDAIYRYGNSWIMSVEEASSRAVALFRSADDAGVSNSAALAELGLDGLNTGDYQAAKEYLERSLAMFAEENPDGTNPNEQYNLGIANLALGNIEESLPYFEYSIATYDNDEYRADAYFMAARGTLLSGMIELGEDYLARGFDEFPADIRFGQNLINSALSREDYETAAFWADRFFAATPHEPGTTRTIVNVYNNYGLLDELVFFFERNIAVNVDDAMTMGNLSFHFALILQSSDTQAALQQLDAAEEYFRQTFPEGNGVFNVIDELRASLNVE